MEKESQQRGVAMNYYFCCDLLTQAYKEVEKVIRDFPSPIKTRLNKPEITSTLFFVFVAKQLQSMTSLRTKTVAIFIRI